MLKRTLIAATFFISACVTVNIYFPAAAVERAAEQIVKETWGGSGEPAKAPPNHKAPTHSRHCEQSLSTLSAKLMHRKPTSMFPIRPFAR
jgi:hypothetical protein